MKELIEKINGKGYLVDFDQNDDFTWDLWLYKRYDLKFEKVLTDTDLESGLEQLFEFIESVLEKEEQESIE